MSVFSPLEWFTLVAGLRAAASNEARDALLAERRLDAEALLESILRAVRVEADDILRINLLVFLHENSTYLVKSPAKLPKLYETLNGLLVTSDLDTLTMNIRQQIVVTLTTLLVESDALTTQPVVLESFVDVLWDIVMRVNGGDDRGLRAACCDCFRELETVYPGLLGVMLGSLWTFCQEERTHAVHAYLTLVTTILHNSIVMLVEMGGDKLRSTPEMSPRTSPPGSPRRRSSHDLSALASPTPRTPIVWPQFAPNSDITPFALPAHLAPAGHVPRARPLTIKPAPSVRPGRAATASVGAAPPPPPEGAWDALVKHVKRCVSYVVDNASLLTPWMVAQTVRRLMQVVQLSRGAIAPSLFKLQFQRLAMADDALLLHVLLHVRREFPDTFTADDQRLLCERLLVSLNDARLATEHRLLMLQWLTSSPANGGFGDAENLYKHAARLYPSTFDPLEVKEAKLDALSRCYDDISASPRYRPAQLVSALLCVEDFHAHASGSAPVWVVFRTLATLLKRFPSLSLDIENMVVSSTLQSPKFIPDVTHFLQAINSFNPAAAESTKLALCRLLAQHARNGVPIDAFLVLVDQIAQDVRIAPTDILAALFAYVTQSNVCTQASFRIGTRLLEVANSLMATHPTAVLFRSLGAVLRHLATRHGDIVIRDRARQQLLLLTHVSGSKLQAVLSSRHGGGAVGDVHAELSAALVFPPTAPIRRCLTRFLVLDNVTPRRGEHASAGTAQGGGNVDLLETYKSHLAQMEVRPITLGFDVRFATEAETTTLDAPPVAAAPTRARNRINEVASAFSPSQIFAVVLATSTPKGYIPATAIKIPFLTRPTAGANTSAGAAADAGSAPVQLVLRPQFPLPATLDVDTVFTDDEGQSCTGSVAPLAVLLEHLMLPVALPHGWQEGRRGELFEVLWDVAMDGPLAGPRVKDGSQTHGAESVRSVYRATGEVEAQLTGALAPFVVSGPAPQARPAAHVALDRSRFTACRRLLIALPSHYHVLLRVWTREDETVVDVRTDFWPVLAHLDDFFDRCLGPSQPA